LRRPRDIILIGKSSRDIALKGTIAVESTTVIFNREKALFRAFS